MMILTLEQKNNNKHDLFTVSNSINNFLPTIYHELT